MCRKGTIRELREKLPIEDFATVTKYKFSTDDGTSSYRRQALVKVAGLRFVLDCSFLSQTEQGSVRMTITWQTMTKVKKVVPIIVLLFLIPFTVFYQNRIKSTSSSR